MESSIRHREYLRMKIIQFLFLLVVYSSFNSILVQCKIVEGSLRTSRDRFIFLARFCFFADTSATLKYSLAYPNSYCEKDSDGNYLEGCQELVLYYDEKFQWEYVYKNDDLTCEEKVSTELLHPSQIVSLKPGSSHQTGQADTYRLFSSGCWLRKSKIIYIWTIAQKIEMNHYSISLSKKILFVSPFKLAASAY